MKKIHKILMGLLVCLTPAVASAEVIEGDIFLEVGEGSIDLAGYQIHLELNPSIDGIRFESAQPHPDAPFDTPFFNAAVLADGTLFASDFTGSGVQVAPGLGGLLRYSVEVDDDVSDDFEVVVLMGNVNFDTVLSDKAGDLIAFTAEGNTLVVIPEPASAAILATFGGLLSVCRRRLG